MKVYALTPQFTKGHILEAFWADMGHRMTHNINEAQIYDSEKLKAAYKMTLLETDEQIAKWREHERFMIPIEKIEQIGKRIVCISLLS